MKICCAELRRTIESRRYPIGYNCKVREYFIELLGYFEAFDEMILEKRAMNVIQLISFCPFCGKKLPDSLRDKWFEHLESQNSEDFDPWSEDIPEEYKDDTWWKKRNL
jgi:hypothetical protein